MKLLSYLLLTLFAMNCGATQVGQTAAVETTESPKSTKSNNTFTEAERIGEIMNYLASNDMKGREAGSEGIEMAATYIENYFKSYGVQPYFESYRDTLSNWVCLQLSLEVAQPGMRA